MRREINCNDYVAENRIRFRRTLLRMGKPGRRERPRDPDKAFVLFLLALKRKKKWLQEGKLAETGPREYILR
ncbi:MAG: hypothetical protein AB1426_05410 [Bacillota bacterium]